MTIQAEEKIKIDGKIYSLLSRPFEPFLKALEVKLIPMTTACRRGYVGEWEIMNNVLYMTKITLQYHPKDEEKMIPLKIDDVIYQATWYTGDLIVAMVEPILYHSSYQPVYTKEMHIKIEDGLIVNHKIVENEIPEIEDDGLPF